MKKEEIRELTERGRKHMGYEERMEEHKSKHHHKMLEGVKKGIHSKAKALKKVSNMGSLYKTEG